MTQPPHDGAWFDVVVEPSDMFDVRLKVDARDSSLAETIEGIAAEAVALLDALEGLPKLLLGALEGGAEVFVELSCVDLDDGAAARAGELTVAAEASKDAVVLLAALRAGNSNLGVISGLLRHLTGSCGGDTSTGAPPAGSGNSPDGGEVGAA